MIDSPAGIKLLVIDDNADGADMLALLAAIEGFKTRAAHSGEAGLRAAQEFAPDVVLCDLVLPDISGYEIARALRADQNLNHCALIAISGWARDEDRTETAHVGFDAHLRKPVAAAELFETVRKVRAMRAQVNRGGDTV